MMNTTTTVRVLANTNSGITDGCFPQVAVDHKGANLASVTETSNSSKDVYVSGCWSSPAANTVFRFPEDGFDATSPGWRTQ